ncbi:hypothetical protein [Salinispora pacifica]|uniref:hypothetical protein n=1 Tax=Salinispora pacifica TaxID=351187 RepID=UPI000370F613|nr:hypothetical protein [Salinispora pacifica]
MKLPRSAAGWTVAIFGLLALLVGAVGLIWPEALLRLLGFEVLESRASGDYTATFLTASSMASFNMGVYYLLAAATEWRAFYRFTVGFRLLTFTVFSVLVLADAAPGRFFGVAAWEALGALATAAGLWWDRRGPGAAAPGGAVSPSADPAGPASTADAVR